MRRCSPFFVFSLVFFIMYELFGPFRYGTVHYFYMPSYGPAIMLLLSIFTCQKFLGAFRMPVVLMMISWIVFAFAFQIGYRDLVTFRTLPIILNQMLRVSVCIMAFLAMANCGDRRAFKIVLITSTGAILLQCAMCLIVLQRDPTLARSVVTAAQISGEMFAQEIKHEAMRDGVASYSFIHAIPLLFPVLIAIIKDVRIRRMVKVSVMVLLLFLFLFLVKTDFATPILLSLALGVLAVMYSKNKAVNLFLVFLVALVLLVFIIWGENIKLGLLRMGQEVFTEGAIAGKIDDIVNAQGDVNHMTQADNRMERYSMSWMQFFTHPLWGCADSQLLGGHCYFVDILGFFGLFFSLPFFVALFSVLRMISRMIIPGLRIYYGLAFAGYLFFGCVKNAGENEYYDILFLVAPCVLYYEGLRMRPYWQGQWFRR